MKIGQVAKICNVSIDTIRYYITMDLLFPQKADTQLHFSEKDISDLRFIIFLKELNFSLNEIREIILLKHTSNWIESSTLNDYLNILYKKRSELLGNIDVLNKAIENIDNEIGKILNRDKPVIRKKGMPLQFLPLLCCPVCNQPLSIDKAKIFYNSIISGEINCVCGYSAAIREGIIATHNKYFGSFDNPDLGRNLYKGLCSDMLRVYQETSNYILEKLLEVDLKNKVVLEANINGYFFLYKHLSELSDGGLYIICDKYYETLSMYKELIESMDLDINVVYIADALSQYPVKKQSVDVGIEFFSNNEYQFYHSNNFITDVSSYYSLNSIIIGSYMSFDSISKSRQNIKIRYPESSVEAYDIRAMIKAFEGEDYKVSLMKLLTIKKTQNSFSFICHIDDENLNPYVYTARRLPQIRE